MLSFMLRVIAGICREDAGMETARPEVNTQEYRRRKRKGKSLS